MIDVFWIQVFSNSFICLFYLRPFYNCNSSACTSNCSMSLFIISPKSTPHMNPVHDFSLSISLLPVKCFVLFFPPFFSMSFSCSKNLLRNSSWKVSCGELVFVRWWIFSLLITLLPVEMMFDSYFNFFDELFSWSLYLLANL